MSRARLLALAYVAFVSLGLPDGVLGVAWPSAHRDLGVAAQWLGVPLAVLAAFAFGSSLSARWLVERLGAGGVAAASAALVAAGTAVYAAAPGWAVFLAGAALVGAGSGAVDSAMNAYGAKHFGPRQMVWLHAAYGAGAMSGPVLMTWVLARGARWTLGYALIAAALAALAAAFAATRRWWEEAGDAQAAGPAATATTTAAEEPGSPRRAAAAMAAHAVLFFLYTGLEVSAGQWSFSVLREGRGAGVVEAGASTSGFWAAFLGGRVVLGFVIEPLGTSRLLRLAMAVALAGAALFSAGGAAFAGVPGLLLLGFALAPIYPGLMSETPRRVGSAAASRAVGVQVSAAILGVITVPNLAGLAAARFGLEAVPVLLLVIAAAMLAIHEALLARLERR